MLEFGRDTVNHPGAVEDMEWIVTNGIGGFASGTVGGSLTRRYHGLLVAALNPPLGRYVLLTKIDETVTHDGQEYALSTNHWETEDSKLQPSGYLHLDRFHLEGTTPVWTYRIGGAVLEKRVFMTPGENTTYVRYTMVRGVTPLAMTLKLMGNYTDFHQTVRNSDRRMRIQLKSNGLKVTAYEDATPYYIIADGADDIVPHHVWYRDYFLSVEHYRGFEPLADHLHIGTAIVKLKPGESFNLIASTEEAPETDATAVYQSIRQREADLIDACPIQDKPDWIQQLVLAADQFIVRRKAGDNPDGRSIIAGYHWFGDWGRDTMIALPGLTLVTGRYDEAASILRTFAAYVDRGMLPNRFPDDNDVPDYNTVDATLWYFEAIRAYHAATEDDDLLREVFPVLQDIVQWHVRGTRYNIQVDPADGLLVAGQDGVQLTWMDAKIDDWVVTPRTGKAVEINALWYNALRSLASFASRLHMEDTEYNEMADRVLASFDRFWNADKGYCYDVIDTPDGSDPSMRPNQIFAASLHYAPLSDDRARAVVDACTRYLLTPHGLRSLAAFEADYTGRYYGNFVQRDSTYHQGTVWAWLIGAYVSAHLRVYSDVDAACDALDSLRLHLSQKGIGTIAEIFDGDPPFTPHGAFAQAWSVSEVLRAWSLLDTYKTWTGV